MHLNAVEGKYEILEKISEGGMGAVYKVRHRLLERIRVIKIMRPQLAADREMRSRFLREARLAGSLRHPNIAQVYDFAIEKAGEAFLVMEYVNGVTLQQVLANYGPPSPAWTLDVICQALDALHYLHQKGVIHRDLSPDNIMVTRDEEGKPVAKLIDLGIAKLVESESSLTAQGSFIGKVRYASPELFKGQEGVRVDVESDLYAMGLVLYEVLTGIHPMGENDVSGYIAAHLFKEPKPFSETDPSAQIPESVRNSVMQALEKKPEDRQAGAGAFREQLLQSLPKLRQTPHETELILDCCAKNAPKKAPDTQEKLDAHFEFGMPSGEATDIRALLEKAEPTALQSGPSPVAPTLSLQESKQESSDDRTRVLSTGRKQIEKKKRRSLRNAGLATLVLLLIALGLFVRSALRRPSPTPAAAPATLILDAQPWANVASIEGPDGAPVKLSPDCSTPLRLQLPAGHYRATLRRAEDSRTLDLDLAPGAETRRLTHFETVSPEDFFASMHISKH